jgi:hypothetical protein
VTEFFIDIAFYQTGLSMAAVKTEGFAGVIARSSTGYGVSRLHNLARHLSVRMHDDEEVRHAAAALVNKGAEGPMRSSADSAFAGFKRQAQSIGLPFAAYHFLYPSRSVSIADQVATAARSIGDTSVMVMIDHEPDGSGAPIPTVNDHLQFALAMRAKGYKVGLSYLPHWVWQDHMGSPSLAALANAGLLLQVSSYVGGSGYASALYPGDNSFPAGYGGMSVWGWQFTDTAKVAGYNVDANAVRGSGAVAAMFSNKPTPTPVNDTEVPTMVIISPDRNKVPAGQTWPGDFMLFDNGMLKHIAPKANNIDNEVAYRNGGVKGPNTITWDEFNSYLALPVNAGRTVINPSYVPE